MPQIGDLSFNPVNGDIFNTDGEPVEVIGWEDLGYAEHDQCLDLPADFAETLRKNTTVTTIGNGVGNGLGEIHVPNPEVLVSALAACQQLRSFQWAFGEGNDRDQQALYQRMCETLAVHPGIQSVHFHVEYDIDNNQDRLSVDSLVHLLENNQRLRILGLGQKRLNEDELIALLGAIDGHPAFEALHTEEFPDENFEMSGPHGIDYKTLDGEFPFFDDPGLMVTRKVLPLLVNCIRRNRSLKRLDLTMPRFWLEEDLAPLHAALRARMFSHPITLSEVRGYPLWGDDLSDKEIFTLGREIKPRIEDAMSMTDSADESKRALLEMAADPARARLMGATNAHYLKAIALDCGDREGLDACMVHANAMLALDKDKLTYYEHMRFIMDKIFMGLLGRSDCLDAMVYGSTIPADQIGALPVSGAMRVLEPSIPCDSIDFKEWVDSINVETAHDKQPEWLEALLLTLCEIAQRQLELGFHEDCHLLGFRGLDSVMNGSIRCVERRERALGGACASEIRYRLFGFDGPAASSGDKRRRSEADVSSHSSKVSRTGGHQDEEAASAAADAGACAPKPLSLFSAKGHDAVGGGAPPSSSANHFFQ